MVCVGVTPGAQTLLRHQAHPTQSPCYTRHHVHHLPTLASRKGFIFHLLLGFITRKEHLKAVSRRAFGICKMLMISSEAFSSKESHTRQKHNGPRLASGSLLSLLSTQLTPCSSMVSPAVFGPLHQEQVNTYEQVNMYEEMSHSLPSLKTDEKQAGSIGGTAKSAQGNSLQASTQEAAEPHPRVLVHTRLHPPSRRITQQSLSPAGCL